MIPTGPASLFASRSALALGVSIVILASGCGSRVSTAPESSAAAEPSGGEAATGSAADSAEEADLEAPGAAFAPPEPAPADYRGDEGAAIAPTRDAAGDYSRLLELSASEALEASLEDCDTAMEHVSTICELADRICALDGDSGPRCEDSRDRCENSRARYAAVCR